MNLIFRLFFFVLIIALSSCVAQNRSGLGPAQLKQCTLSCTQRFDECKRNCVDSCLNCSLSSFHSATANYSKYVRERQIEGKNIARRLKSYRDPLQCRKVSCNCYADLMTCEQNCTGVIHKQLRAVPYCT